MMNTRVSDGAKNIKQKEKKTRVEDFVGSG